MALQEKLNRFKKQQEKCQSTLTSIAAKSSSLKASQPNKAPPTSTFPAATKASTPLKFSNDTERLQHINTIRKSHPSYQIKRVIDLLLETRQALTPEKINEACYVDINRNKAVLDSLRNNVKVSYDGKCFKYKPKHELNGKDELLTFIRKFKDGVAVVDVKDAYPSVMKDLQVLKGEGHVWLVSNVDSQEDIVYPNEVVVTDPKMMLKVDKELKQLFREIELPQDMVDIENELQKNGMKPATNTIQRRARTQLHSIGRSIKPNREKKRKREISRRTKLTNAHLPELFQIN